MKNFPYLFFLMLSSCDDSHINFTVKNNSQVTFDSVIVGGLGQFKIEEFKPSAKVANFIDWSSSETKTDGNYAIKLYKGDSIRIQHFGYYSNGIPMGSQFHLEVQDDTIIVKETFK